MKKNMRVLSSAALLLSLVLLTGCSKQDNPVSSYMEMDGTEVKLNVGETFTRKAHTLSIAPVYYTLNSATL